MNVNGVQYRTATLTNPTLYIEGFVVATRQGYTKHYYNGSERVASSIGLGGITTINTPLILSTNWTTKKTASNTMMNRLLNTCLSVTLGSKVVPFTMNLYRYATIQTGSVDKYYYHTNHLGSSSWITDGSGNAIQHLQNLPYGEDWVDERNTTWNSRYTFTGKEKDAETGYGYFGARYYDSGLSIWLSVDPMSDKYPSMSPYNYCANNPVILVDPDGRWIKGAGFFRNLFNSDAYCTAYLTCQQIPNSHFTKVGKNHYKVTWTTGSFIDNGTNYNNLMPMVTIYDIKMENHLFKILEFDGGGIELYNRDNERDRPGPDRKTKGDAPLTDITNFPTGTGSSGAENIPELVGNMVGLFERGGNFGELFLKYQEESRQKQKNKEKEDEYNNETIFYDVYINKNGRGYTIGGSCSRKDSASTVQKIKKDNE
jgi:RHS repeat-associated protein